MTNDLTIDEASQYRLRIVINIMYYFRRFWMKQLILFRVRNWNLNLEAFNFLA